MFSGGVVGIGQGPTGDEVIDRTSEKGVEAGGPALDPQRAFVLLLAVAVVAGGVILATTTPDRPAIQDSRKEAGGVSPSRAPSVSTLDESGSELSEGQARALFRRLRHKLELAYRRRSVETLLEVVGRGSPQHSQSRSDLRLLERNNLFDRTRSRTLDVSIVEVEVDRLVVSERTVVRPRYIDDATYVGVDVNLGPMRSSSEWTLERLDDRWVITSSRATG